MSYWIRIDEMIILIQTRLSFSLMISLFFWIVFFNCILLIDADCLKFLLDSSSNECSIRKGNSESAELVPQYQECLICTIVTLIPAEMLAVEDDNTCATIELQCIQLIFSTQAIFEDFFASHRSFIQDLFYKDSKKTDQNTLHITLKSNTLDEINAEYIERVLVEDDNAYRVLFLELYQEQQLLRINRDLTNLTRLSIEIILSCPDEDNLGVRRQTIYLIHNRQITLVIDQKTCAVLFVPSIESPPSITPLPSSTDLMPRSSGKSKNHFLILVIGIIGSLLLLSMVCCLKYLKRSALKASDSSRELSISEAASIESPLPIVDTPIKAKPTPARGMRAIQLMEDDI